MTFLSDFIFYKNMFYVLLMTFFWKIYLFLFIQRYLVFFSPFPNLHFSLLTNSFIQNIFWWYQCNLAKVSYAQWMLHHILKPPNLPNMNIRHTGVYYPDILWCNSFLLFSAWTSKKIFFYLNWYFSSWFINRKLWKCIYVTCIV